MPRIAGSRAPSSRWVLDATRALTRRAYPPPPPSVVVHPDDVDERSGIAGPGQLIEVTASEYEALQERLARTEDMSGRLDQLDAALAALHADVKRQRKTPAAPAAKTPKPVAPPALNTAALAREIAAEIAIPDVEGALAHAIQPLQRDTAAMQRDIAALQSQVAVLTELSGVMARFLLDTDHDNASSGVKRAAREEDADAEYEEGRHFKQKIVSAKPN